MQHQYNCQCLLFYRMQFNYIECLTSFPGLKEKVTEGLTSEIEERGTTDQWYIHQLRKLSHICLRDVEKLFIIVILHGVTTKSVRYKRVHVR